MSRPNIRNSSQKRAKRTGFRYRMKTKGGRKVLRRHRKIGRQLTPKG
ncbi:MAG: 50S ribosomal protein L34 [Planctomycetes bacterium]|nr:50S ribosomal protein L34 [Planctomycetota bacterium]